MLRHTTGPNLAGIVARVITALKAHLAKYLLLVNPLLVAFLPVSLIYGANVGEVTFSGAATTMLVIMASASLFMLAVWLIVRNGAAASFLATIWLFMFFFYGHIFDLTTGASLGGFVFGRYRYLIAMDILVALGALLLAFRARHFCVQVRPVISVALLAPLLFTWISIGISRVAASDTKISGIEEIENIKLPQLPQERLPDIYYIILDTYPRDDVLRSVFGFDNNEFLDQLENNDFYIASSSTTNYIQTHLSLASSLNMDYLQNLVDDVQPQSNNSPILRSLVQDNKAALLSQRMGYQFAFLRTYFDITLVNPHSDSGLSNIGYPFGPVGRLVLQPILGTEFNFFLIRTTMLRQFVNFGFDYFAADLFTKKIDQLKRISEVEGPTYTFAHFVPPHPPYVFDREGNLRNVEFSTQSWGDKEGYIDQLVWVNKSIAEVVDYILENNKENSVIVIQGDHGPEISDTHRVIALGGEPDADLVRERTGVLNAIHLPKMCRPGNLYETITSVNTFRVIFDACWGTEFGLLEDDVYWSNYENPFDFTPVDEVARSKSDQ